MRRPVSPLPATAIPRNPAPARGTGDSRPAPTFSQPPPSPLPRCHLCSCRSRSFPLPLRHLFYPLSPPLRSGKDPTPSAPLFLPAYPPPHPCATWNGKGWEGLRARSRRQSGGTAASIARKIIKSPSLIFTARAGCATRSTLPSAPKDPFSPPQISGRPNWKQPRLEVRGQGFLASRSLSLFPSLFLFYLFARRPVQ